MKGFLDRVVAQRALEQLGDGHEWWMSQREYVRAAPQAAPQPEPEPRPVVVLALPALPPRRSSGRSELEKRIAKDVARARRALAKRGLL